MKSRLATALVITASATCYAGDPSSGAYSDPDTLSTVHGSATVITPWGETTGAAYTVRVFPNNGFEKRRSYVFRLLNVGVIAPLGAEEPFQTLVGIGTSYGRLVLDSPGRFNISIQVSSPGVAEAYEPDTWDTRTRIVHVNSMEEETVELLVETCAQEGCP